QLATTIGYSISEGDDHDSNTGKRNDPAPLSASRDGHDSGTGELARCAWRRCQKGGSLWRLHYGRAELLFPQLRHGAGPEKNQRPRLALHRVLSEACAPR